MQLAKLRADAHMSQECVARELKVSRATIDNWEKGRTEPSLSHIKALANLFGISTDELLGVK